LSIIGGQGSSTSTESYITPSSLIVYYFNINTGVEGKQIIPLKKINRKRTKDIETLINDKIMQGKGGSALKIQE
jgi:hypothetical protein